MNHCMLFTKYIYIPGISVSATWPLTKARLSRRRRAQSRRPASAIFGEGKKGTQMTQEKVTVFWRV